MTKIHPAFRNIADRYISGVCSEALLPGEYKIFHHLDIATPNTQQFTHSEDFPSEPSYLTSMTAAYIDKDGSSIRRISMHGLSGDEIQPCDKRVVGAYNNSVCALQGLVKSLESIAPFMDLARSHPRFGKLGQWAIDATKKDGKRLIAAHLMFVNCKNGEIEHGMSIPTALKETFPLMIRNAIEPLVLKRDDLDLTTEEIEKLETNDKLFSAIMSNSGDLQVVSAIPPSAVMPMMPNYKATLEAYHNLSNS